MMRFWKKLLCILVFLSLAGYHNLLLAQEKNEIHVFGKILDGETSEPIPGIHVVNKNSVDGTVSDIDGNFSIHLDPGDSIYFSSVAYQPQYFIFPDSSSHFSDDKIIITLAPATVELAPVDVFAYQSEQDFKNAVIALELPEEKTAQLTIPGFYYGPKRPVKAGVGSPISFLVSKFGKKAKQEKRFNEAKERDAYRNFISAKYNKDIVGKVTGLKAEKLKEFMEQCTLSDSFIENANEYDIIVAINNCFEEYNNNN